MINKIYVLNLPHRQDRRYFMAGHLETVGVREDEVRFFEAKYGKDYESLDAIIDAAISDGFPEFEQDRHQTETTTRLSYRWNWCRMMREIIKSGQIVLVLLDDRMLKIRWDHLCTTVNRLVHNHGPFDILQVGWSNWLGDNGYVPGQIVDGFIARGLRSLGDWGTVLSPSGAKKVLSETLETRRSPEVLFYRWCKADIPTVGFFHCIESQIRSAPIRWGEDIDHEFD